MLVDRRSSMDTSSLPIPSQKTPSLPPDMMSVTYHDSDDETSATGGTDIDDLLTPMSEDVDELVAQQRTTYFMDGGNRFISLPTLGTNKTTSQISRVFEEWLEDKLYNNTNDELLPILEENVEYVAEEIFDKLKKHSFSGLSKVLVKIRTGHVYTYHQLEDGQPLITQDMEEFFQQFPLFVEVVIQAATNQRGHTQLLLELENATVNPGDPYRMINTIGAA
ncbi:hypothetical protein VTP01DRAFT_6833 [Rhizomucor pusillus]|uniref:uncharacterized protein n=1 Tax=Rhizomucor pusillus TaxID=4840 RepID=UPI003743C303